MLSQVDGVCPLCVDPLFYKKNNKTYKYYEIAHIYPLNATPAEEVLLEHEERLSEDLNDEANVIPLCKGCHGKFDKPRTVEEYRELVVLKKKIIVKGGQEDIWKRYDIQDDIHAVIDAIYEDPSFDTDADIDYSPKTVDDKLDQSISRPTHRKIKNNVQDYYVFIREKFEFLDQNGEEASKIISMQIKLFYLNQKKYDYTQQVIFENTVNWINAKTKPDTTDAAEIIASFFVQNCEVFE
nr:ABC-three component system protein [Falsiruegeria litorea]